MMQQPLLLVRGGGVGAHPNTGCRSSSVWNHGRSDTEWQGQQCLRSGGGEGQMRRRTPF